MKTLIPFTLLLSFIFLTTLISCGSDDDTQINDTSLVGVWQRSDYDQANEDGEIHQYRYYFRANQEGYSTFGIEYPDGAATSSLRSFTWSSTGNQLTMSYDIDDELSTAYSFNDLDQLILSELTDIPFNEIEE